MVASREELVSILRHLMATGLPPFGAIVHLVAACRGKKITITWKEPPEEKPPSLRVHCIIESDGRQVYQFQRVRLFGTPESISAVAARLAELPGELRGILNDPRALPELAVLLFTELGQPELSEGIITLLADGMLKGGELNQPAWHAKYPSVLQDLALLTKSLERLPAGRLRPTLMVRNVREWHLSMPPRWARAPE